MWRVCGITVVLLGLSLGCVEAGTVQTFDGGGTPYTFANFSGPAATVLAGGPTGNFLRLAYATDGWTTNTVAFDRTDAGAFDTVVVDFDFRMGLGTRADGIGFALLNTATLGTTGAGPVVDGEANVANSLSVGFDIFNNDYVFGPVVEPSNNHVSLRFNGFLTAVPVDTATLDLANNLFNHAQVTVQAAGAGSNVTMTLTPNGGVAFTPINAFYVAGLTPYESRLSFGAGTGAEMSNHDIDNISATFSNTVPEPSAWLLASCGALIVIVHRRRWTTATGFK
jgi:hypothetical protein